MDSIKIEDYLQNRQPNKTGTCKQCGKQIPWNRQKLGNHKRSGNCLGQSKQEQNMFKSLNTNSTIFIGNQPESTFTESNPKRLLNYEMFWERQRRSLENLKKTNAGCPKYTILSENSKNCKTRMTFSKNVFETAGIFFIRNLWVGLICSIRQPKVVLEWLETTEERQLLN